MACGCSLSSTRSAADRVCQVPANRGALTRRLILSAMASIKSVRRSVQHPERDGRHWVSGGSDCDPVASSGNRSYRRRRAPGRPPAPPGAPPVPRRPQERQHVRAETTAAHSQAPTVRTDVRNYRIRLTQDCALKRAKGRPDGCRRDSPGRARPGCGWASWRWTWSWRVDGSPSTAAASGSSCRDPRRAT